MHVNWNKSDLPMSIPELSLCFNSDQKSSFLLDMLKSSANPLLRKLQLHVRPLPWGEYKQALVSMALQNSSADMSQVGFPLTEDLLAMNALLPIVSDCFSRRRRKAVKTAAFRRIIFQAAV